MNNIIEEYNVNFEVYQQYGVTLKSLLTNIIDQVPVHSISYRIKELDSLKKK